jgi:ubiquinone/menaquinone biosynthesis C-methylase UbiE
MLSVIAGLLLTIASLMVLFVLVIGVVFLFDIFLELPYVGTRRAKIKTIMELSKIQEGETLVDLGSGDGRLLVEAAKGGAHAIGYEINPFLVFVTIIHSKLRGVREEVKVYQSSLWKADLAIADVVLIYAMRKTMPRFEEFIYKNCKKGTRIVVNTNPFPNKKPQKEENGVFLYIA